MTTLFVKHMQRIMGNADSAFSGFEDALSEDLDAFCAFVEVVKLTHQESVQQVGEPVCFASAVRIVTESLNREALVELSVIAHMLTYGLLLTNPMLQMRGEA